MKSAPYDIVFAGASSADSATVLGKKLGIPVGKTEVKHFVNSEFRLRVLTEVTGKNCLIVASTGAPVHDRLFELFLLVDALKKGRAKSIVALIPYFAYARQHTDFREGEAVSCDVLFRMFAMLGVDRIITCDLHHVESADEVPLPIKNLSALPFLADVVKKKIAPATAVVISPDEGGVARARMFADTFFGGKVGNFTFIRKERSLHKAHHITGATLTNPKLISGKTAVIVDDICTSGKTLLSAVTLCMKHGAKDVYAVVVHPDMSTEAVNMIIASPLKKLWTTNSVGKKRYPKKIEVRNISEMLTTELL